MSSSTSLPSSGGSQGGAGHTEAGEPASTPDLDGVPPLPRSGVLATLRAYVALTKPRIIELLLVTTVPTMIVAQNGLPSLWLMTATVLGGTFAAGGANAINMCVDRLCFDRSFSV